MAAFELFKGIGGFCTDHEQRKVRDTDRYWDKEKRN